MSRRSARSRRIARWLAAVALSGIALLGLATPALAHNTLVGSDPADGASLASGPGTVTLTFDQPVQEGFNTVTVLGPNGDHWENGAATVRGNVVSAQVRPLGPAGTYTVGYRILSADGHPVYGSVKFTLTAAGTGTPAPPSSAAASAPSGGGDQGGGTPIWPWLVGAAVLLGVGVVFALRAGNSR